MSKTVRKLLVVVAIASILFMSTLIGFRFYRVYIFHQYLGRIQDFALENGIMLDVRENITDIKFLKSNTDSKLAMNVNNALRSYDFSIYNRFLGSSLERVGNTVVFSANLNGDYHLKGKSDGRSYEFTENGMRKRFFLPADAETIETARSTIEKCIESSIKKYMPEYFEQGVNIKINLVSKSDDTVFLQDDFLYLVNCLEEAKASAIWALLLFLFYLSASVSFFVSGTFLQSLFAGIAFFISCFICHLPASTILLMLTILVVVNTLISLTKNRYVMGAVYLVLALILDFAIMHSPYGSSFGNELVADFIGFTVSAIDIFVCAILLDSVRHLLKDFNLTPSMEINKRTVCIELSQSFICYLAEIKTKLARYVPNIYPFVPGYEVIVNGELKENEYRITKDEKIFCSKVLDSSGISDVDIDIIVGTVIVAKNS